jgi:hypothetical protein
VYQQSCYYTEQADYGARPEPGPRASYGQGIICAYVKGMASSYAGGGGGSNVPVGERPWILVWDLDKTLVHHDVSNNPNILNTKAIQFLDKAIKSDSVAYIFLLTNNADTDYIEQAIINIRNEISALNTYPSNSFGLDETNIKIRTFDAIKYRHVYKELDGTTPAIVSPAQIEQVAIQQTEDFEGIPGNNYRFFGSTLTLRLPRIVQEDPHKSLRDIIHLIKIADIHNRKDNKNINTNAELAANYKIMFFDDLDTHVLSRQIQKNIGGIEGIFHLIPALKKREFVPDDFSKEYVKYKADNSDENFR